MNILQCKSTILRRESSHHNMISKATILLLLILILTSVVSEQEKEQDDTITRLLRHIANIDNEHIKYELSKKLSRSIGFGVNVPLFPTHTDNEENYYRNNTHDKQRNLAGDYKFTPCPNERPCNTIIATYTKQQVKSILETILIKLINVDGWKVRVSIILCDMNVCVQSKVSTT